MYNIRVSLKLCRVSGGSIIDGPDISFPTENKRIRYIVIVYKLSIIFIPKVKCQNNFSHKILSFFTRDVIHWNRILIYIFEVIRKTFRPRFWGWNPIIFYNWKKNNSLILFLKLEAGFLILCYHSRLTTNSLE